MMLPEPFRFLRIGWWIVHIIGISLVFYLGHKFGGAIFRAILYFSKTRKLAVMGWVGISP
jgi:hypothetical protein